MNIFRKVLHIMANDITALLEEISAIHSDHDIEQEVTDKVAEAVNTALPAAVATATAALQKEADDNATAIKAIADKLTAGDVAGATADATAAAGAASSDTGSGSDTAA